MKTAIETINDIFLSRNITTRSTAFDPSGETCCLWLCTEKDGFSYSALLHGGKTVELRKFLGEFDFDRDSADAEFGELPHGIQLDGSDGELFCAAWYPADDHLSECLNVFSETAHRLFSIAEASAPKET